MARLSSLRSTLTVSAMLAVAGFLSTSCGGSSTDSGGKSQGVKPGDACAADGVHAVSEDGCNTCTCAGNAWSCTEMDCAPPPDGGGSSPGICLSGAVMDAPDGCNTCSCTDGTWACTKKACPAPACTEGETMNDGCNGCLCTSGQWACTTRYCPATDAGPAARGCGARLGDACSPDEYCAYEVGQMCGAADASSICLPRPQACDSVYEPVCGCDGKTYGNSCEAAIARTGVNTQGECLLGR